jgi:ribosomal protein S6--L-glutamate ligase
MRIILLASNPKLYSNQRLIEAAKNRGHEIEFINVGECYIKVAPNACEVFYDDNKKIEKIDYVIPRLKPSMTFYGSTIVRQFEVMQVSCLNGSDAITKSRDKLHTLQILSQHGLNLPLTSFANSSYDTKDLIKLVESAPLVVKLLEGTKGVGVVLAETNKAAESVINAFRSLKADILVQQYIKESKGQDIRCFVVGNQVVASMERIAQEGEFRANIHLGATARAIEISQEEREIAIKAAKVLNLEVAGVDMVRSNNGAKILEVNSSPGLEGIELATGINIADKMFELVESSFFSKN